MEYKAKATREMKKNAKGKEYAFVSKEELAAFKKAGLGDSLTDLMNYEAKMRKGDAGKTRSISSGSGPTKAQQDALDKKMMELQNPPMKKSSSRSISNLKADTKKSEKADMTGFKKKDKTDIIKDAMPAPKRVNATAAKKEAPARENRLRSVKKEEDFLGAYGYKRGTAPVKKKEEEEKKKPKKSLYTKPSTMSPSLLGTYAKGGVAKKKK
jgi:hypothetical protein